MLQTNTLADGTEFSFWEKETKYIKELYVAQDDASASDDNDGSKEATKKNKPFPLTPNEYQLLTYLIINSDRAVPRAELLDKIWGYETQVETRVADDTVKRLRKKIQDSSAKIATVWGYGFRLVDRNFTPDIDGQDDE